MVTVYVPGATAAPTVTVAVEVNVVPLSVAGVNATVGPAGATLLVRATSAVKFVRTSVTVEVPDALCATVTVAGLADSAIAAAAVTVTVSVVVAFVTPVPAPVMVTVYVPGATAAPTVTVAVEVNVVPLSVAGVNATVGPAGATLLVRATSAVKLFRVSVTVAVPAVPPAGIVKAAGATASAMLDAGGAVTVNASVAVALVIPVPVPVIVIVEVPVATVAGTSTVIVDVVPVALAGLKLTVAPVGAPLLVNATAPVKFVRAIVRVLVPDCPCWMLKVAGTSDNEIAGTTGAVTVTVNVAV
jgi:hypothetical protein